MAEILQTYFWIGAVIFMRAGTILMTAPVFGEQGVPARFRLTIALLTVMAVAPSLRGIIPAQPASLAGMLQILFAEFVVGAMIGGAGRILMSATHVMGQIGSLQSGLAFAQFLDPSQGTPNSSLSIFAGLAALAVVLAGDFHHMFLLAAAESYKRFPAGAMPLLSDAAALMIRSVTEMFRLGVQMAAPLVIFGLVFNAALALLSRLAPQIQVFFIFVGPSIQLSLFVFMASLGTAMMVFADGIEAFFRGFL